MSGTGDARMVRTDGLMQTLLVFEWLRMSGLSSVAANGRIVRMTDCPQLVDVRFVPA